MAFVVGMGLGYMYCKIRDRKNKHWRSQINPNLPKETYKRILLAKLIKGVYQQAKGRDPLPYSTEHNYEILQPCEFLKDEDFKKDEMRTALSRGFFVVYRNEKRNIDQRESERRPGFVIAVRGTKTLEDLWDDGKLAFQNLHRTEWVICLELVLERLIQFSEITRLGHPFDAGICLTGHSLGAAVCLLVARKYALENGGKKLIDSHLFNPPFFTFANLFDIASSLMESTELKLVQAFFGDLKTRIQIIQGVLKVHLMQTNPNAAEKVMDTHNILSRWSPSLYINSNDYICYLYHQHFQSLWLREPNNEWSRNLEFYHKTTTLLVAEKLRDKKRYKAGYNFHLIPTAELHMMRTMRMRPLSAHRLYNWIHPDASVDFERKTITYTDARQSNEYDEFKIELNIQSVSEI